MARGTFDTTVLQPDDLLAIVLESSPNLRTYQSWSSTSLRQNPCLSRGRRNMGLLELTPRKFEIIAVWEWSFEPSWGRRKNSAAADCSNSVTLRKSFKLGLSPMSLQPAMKTGANCRSGCRSILEVSQAYVHSVFSLQPSPGGSTRFEQALVCLLQVELYG